MTLVEKIILSAAKVLPQNEADFNALKRELSRLEGKKEPLPDKTKLLTAYHKLLKEKRIAKNKPLEKLLARRAVRSLSGVAIVTSLVKPYPCPGQCVYCPLDERQPKSYLSEEPAAMRALLLKFNPYDQMAKRIEALEANGHPTDKIELIIKGGTWNSYPLAYQYWFVLRSYEGANGENSKFQIPNSKFTETSPLAELKKELFRQQKINERAKHRVIGLTLETRPDCINYHTIWQMREMGCTRLEIGVQHTDDEILKLTKRGHDSAAAKRATELLKNYGFKTDFHLMPQLPGATPEADLEMLKKIFTDPGYRPDMIKVYPCSVIKNSELYEWWRDGKYQPYPGEDLIRILKEFKKIVPRYCRISRLIRDIPGQYIEAGNKVTNLRQVIQEQLRKEGKACKCLRCREIGHATIGDKRKTIENIRPKLFIDEYATHGGREFFLSFEDAERTLVFAFCRLRLVDKPVIHPNKKLNSYRAYIRELHTYGQLIEIKQKDKKTMGQNDDREIQHTGLGKKLIREAEKIARENKVKKLAVISGVGVRDYYRHLGYRLEKTYLVKNLA